MYLCEQLIHTFVISAQLDNRLAKIEPPTKTSTRKIPEHCQSQPTEPQNHLGDFVYKSIATNGKQFQTTSQFKIEVALCKNLVFLCVLISQLAYQVVNAWLSSGFGPLSKLSAVNSTRATVWEIFIGSAVNKFCVSANYVLTCSVDGTLRFLDIKTGALLMPIIKLSCIAVQCSFVSNNK